MKPIAPMHGVRRAAFGLAVHGIGRAVQIDETAAAFAGVAMGLNDPVTALRVPALVPLVPRLLA